MEYLIIWLGKAAVPFMLVFARVIGIFATAPVFNSRSVPNTVRVALALTITFLYYSTLHPKVPTPSSVMVLMLMVLNEMMTGALIGFVASIIIMAIQAAGEIIDIQMGLSMVQLFNPTTRTQSTAIGRLYFNLAQITFLMVYGHLQVLGVLFNSFNQIPLGHFSFSTGAAWTQFLNASSAIFVIAVQLCLPVIVVLFLIDFSLGIVNRVAQQIDIFSMGMTVKPLTGFSILLLLGPSLIPYLTSIMGVMAADMVAAMQKMALALAQSAGR